jgi:hypothetical protein
MLLTTSDFTDFVGNAIDVVGSHFVGVLANSELTLFTLATHEESSYVIYKTRVMATC